MSRSSRSAADQGAAAQLVCERLTTGHLLATDRSAVAVNRTAGRNPQYVKAGRLTVQRTALDELKLPEDSIDKAFCVNVNLFWVSDAEAELAALRQGLRSGAPLFILYGAEGPTGGDRVTALVAEAVKAAGFDTVEVVTADHGLGVISHAP
ncbi:MULTISPECIES: class I SAM-dependent methyltransferase [Kribbella]|uniref:class I SAM-dependent methyltransferase n=1 Tax=Kribbella TaxID=182639 RepID=UPI0010451D38|nr:MULTISPECIES: class I SAM-dependent methyltransferase [Kribbella]